MVTTFARYGKYTVRSKVNLDPDVTLTYTSKDIEITADTINSTNRPGFYTVADFNEDNEPISCDNRMLESIETMDDLENLKKAVKVAQMIREGEEFLLFPEARTKD